MLRHAARRLVSRTAAALTARRAFATAKVPAEAAVDSTFVEAWKKVAPNIEPPTTPLSIMKPRPPTPATIPTKLTVNFVLPYKSEIANKEVLRYEPTSHLSGAQVLPCRFSSLASNGSQISETYKSGGEMKQSDAQKSSEEATPKVVAFSPLEAAIAKPRSSPLTSESSKVRRSEILTQVTFFMIPALLLVSKNSISTSLLVGAVFHQIYMFHKEILLDYVHHDITRKWALIYFKLLLLVMAKDTIMYFNLF